MAISNLKLYEQKQRKYQSILFKEYEDVVALTIDRETGLGQYTLVSGENIASACLRCEHPRCMYYTDDELVCTSLEDFPLDLDNSVCPSFAITWLKDNPEPTIDESLCVSCGLCVSRCPVGAISFDATFTPSLNTDSNNEHYINSSGKDVFNSMLDIVQSKPRDELLSRINDGHLQIVYSKISNITSDVSLNFPNHLIRNILLELGLYSSIRRRGDVYVRMDMIFSDDTGFVGVAEIETGNDILNSPRNTLDNIAVLHSRYDIPMDKLLPLIVSFSFPNKRSEYWRVLSDIKNITGLKVSSITLGALLMLMWKNKKLTMNELEQFYTDDDTHSIREVFSTILGESFDLELGQLGILENTK